MRVQRVQKVQRVQRGWYRPSGDEYIAALWRQRCRRQRKPNNRACGALEMHPYPRLRRYFPRRGKFALLSASELISISRHKGAKTSPSGGGAVGRRGAFLSPVRAVGLFSSGRSLVVWFSIRGCHKLKLLPLPSTHSAPLVAPATKGGAAGRQHLYGAHRAPSSPAQRFYITPL